MDLEACFRQSGDEHAQGDGLAGAGGSDEGGTHALVHRLGECGGDLCLRIEREPFAHLQFTGKGGLAKAQWAEVVAHGCCSWSSGSLSGSSCGSR